MKIHVVEIDCRKRDRLDIAGTGDNHIGNCNRCINSEQRVIDHIDKHDCFWIHTGDGIEAITKNDIRNDLRALDQRFIDSFEKVDQVIHLEKQEFVKLYSPIKDKLLAMLSGNHPEKVRRMYGTDPYSELAESMASTHLKYKRISGDHKVGYCGYIILFLKGKKQTKRLDIYLHHGWIAARTKGAIVNSLMNSSRDEDWDLLFVGHCHQLVLAPMQILQIGDDYKQRHRHKLAVACPTLLKTYSEDENEGYQGRAGFPPAYIGGLQITIDIDRIFGDSSQTPYQVTIL